ncbi:hypothetical protein D3C71_1359100 [compost metagenome]
MQPRQVGMPQAAHAAGGQQAVHRLHTKPGHAQQQFARRGVQVDRKTLAVRQRPGQLGVHVQRQHALLRCRHDLVVGEAVKAHQPVGLVQPVLAHRGWRGQRQGAGRVGDGAEGRVVHAPQPVHAIQPGAGGEDDAVAGGIGPHDHLRALPAWREVRHAGPARGARLRHGHDGLRRLFLARGAGFSNVHRHAGHGAVDGGAVFFWRQGREAFGRGQLDVDGQAVRIAACALHQLRRCIGNGLQMDVAAKVVLLAQHAGHLQHLLHGVVGALDDAAGEEQPFDAIAAVKVQRELHHLIHREARAGHVAGHAVHAVQAVVLAEVGEQNLEQRDATPVRRIAVADAHAFGRAHAAPADRVARCCAARCTGGVVLGGVGQDGEFGL